jgi:XTP/dITP diphosphohydrolase
MGPGRLVLLTTTHRVAAGLLSWPAWSALRDAERVVVEGADHDLLPALVDAGVETVVVENLPEALGALLDEAGAGASVLVAPHDAEETGRLLARELTARAAAGSAPQVEVLAGSYDLPGARLLDLVVVMDQLRSPGGCPWDAKQTHESLVRFLLEEAYETVEAIEGGDRDHLREELGDLLLQVVFHARLAEEDDDEPWSIDDVAGDIVDKLVRRHPHVFGDAEADTAEHVERNWEVLKAAEKQRGSAMDGVPLAQPALALAAKLFWRAEKAGVTVAVDPGAAAGEVTAESVGARLLALVAEARGAGVDPEAALRAAARDYATRVRSAESP